MVRNGQDCERSIMADYEEYELEEEEWVVAQRCCIPRLFPIEQNQFGGGAMCGGNVWAVPKFRM